MAQDADHKPGVKQGESNPTDLRSFNETGKTRPAMRDLSRHVVPSVAVKWYELGLELLETKHEKYLDVIESDGNKYDVQWCCRKMFRKWLETSDTATWDQLIEAIKSINLNDVASGIPSLLLQDAAYLGPKTKEMSSRTVAVQQGVFEDLDITDCRIDIAFTRVSCKLLGILLEGKFDVTVIRIACFANANTECGIGYPEGLQQKMITAKSVAELIEVLTLHPTHWSWINIQVMEKIASLSNRATKLVEHYKTVISAKRVKEILQDIPDFVVDETFYVRIKEKWKKALDEMTFKDIQDHHISKYLKGVLKFIG
ncbi:uncharacterized protein [Dysidea avara]|uniref:uncharacterized protein n=1 Tax=Dysidea avara TaxID=196820 RepID=UPI00331B3656